MKKTAAIKKLENQFAPLFVNRGNVVKDPAKRYDILDLVQEQLDEARELLDNDFAFCVAGKVLEKIFWVDNELEELKNYYESIMYEEVK